MKNAQDDPTIEKSVKTIKREIDRIAKIAPPKFMKTLAESFTEFRKKQEKRDPAEEAGNSAKGVRFTVR